MKQTLIIRAVPNRMDTQTPESEGARCLPCNVAFLETESLKNSKIAKLRHQNVSKLRIPGYCWDSGARSGQPCTPNVANPEKKDVANRPDCRADGDLMCLHGTDDMNCCLPDPDPSKRRDQHGCLETSQQYVDKNWGCQSKGSAKRIQGLEQNRHRISQEIREPVLFSSIIL